MYRKFAQALKTPLLAAAVASAGFNSAPAVEITGLGYTNHSHDQFGDATPGSPFFTGTVHATNGTQYVTGPSNGLHGSIKTPNSSQNATPVANATYIWSEIARVSLWRMMSSA